MEEKILFTKVFGKADGYIQNDINIGHEVINFFKADDKKNYIYITPSGYIGKDNADKIKTIILYRNTDIPNLKEIIAKISKPSILELKDNEEIIGENIAYGGKKLKEIFRDNIWKENKKIPAQLATFMVEKIEKPKAPLYINVSSKNINLLGIVIKLENLNFGRTYKYIELNEFENLTSIINNESYWNPTSTLETIGEFKKSLEKNFKKHNFIDLIDKQYAETTYSNLFAYIFESSPDLFKLFVQNILDIKNFQDNEIKVKREQERIDLLVTSENHVFIIENKIKSGINGIKKIGDTIIETQLDKYENYIENKYKNKEKHYYIFSPDYNYVNIPKTKKSDKYKLIKYSILYNFYSDMLKNKNYENEINSIQYYQEFVYALSKHTKLIDDSLEIEMKKRFVKKIENSQN